MIFFSSFTIHPTPNILMHQTLLLTMTYHSAQSCNVHVCVGPISDFRLGFFSTDPEKCADSKTLSCFVFFNADFFFFLVPDDFNANMGTSSLNTRLK